MKKYLLRQTDRPLMYESGYGGVKKEKDAFAAFVVLEDGNYRWCDKDEHDLPEWYVVRNEQLHGVAPENVAEECKRIVCEHAEIPLEETELKMLRDISEYSETLTVWQRIPLDYNDFGGCALSEQGQEKYDELISKQIPEALSWCGDEILAPIDYDGDFDISEAISLAATIMMEEYDDEKYWEEF